jgi:N-acetylneuraminate synthase
MEIKLIAEIGINHNGELKNVYKMIDAFDFCDVIKMQKATPKIMLSDKKYNSPHPNPYAAFGDTYGKHKEFLEFDIKEYWNIRDYVEKKGMEFSASVWDLQSAKEIIGINPAYIKIPSCRSNNLKLINYCLANFKGFVHISTGMTTKKERAKILNLSNNIIFYSCTANYKNDGTPIFVEKYPGFSCHAPNIMFGKAAILNGAKWIEYHVTLDKKQKGSDHGISLLPNEYKKIKTWIKQNQKQLNRIRWKKPFDLPICEIEAREKLWSTI